MSVFDWCSHQDHTGCLGKYERFYFGPVKKKRGRGTEIGLIMTDEWAECACHCHKKGKK